MSASTRNIGPEPSSGLDVIEAPALHVAVGVITNARGEVLIAKRPDHLHQGGLWEFPGGKVEPGETVSQALHRELREELAIEVQKAQPLLTVRHAYPDRRVLLDVWRVEAFSGHPRGLENQPLRWIAPEQLAQYPFPAANLPIVAAARLPDRYAIVDLVDVDEARLLRRLDRLSERGVRLAQLRAKTLTLPDLRSLGRLAVHHCRERGITLLLNGEPDMAHQLGAPGVHLTASRLMALKRRPLERAQWVAASCHCPDELRQAERIGADFVVLGPVAPTASHPEARPLGWERFRAWVAEVNLPVYALGGMTVGDIDIARSHGAQGIAGIRSLAGQAEPTHNGAQ
jgi:8-oxo-dGTP diphosphatase